MNRRAGTIKFLTELLLKRNGGLSSILARGVSSTLVFSVVYSCVNFALSLILARGLGTSGYGAYSYAIAWTTLMGVVAKLGFEAIITRDIAAYIERKDAGRLIGLMRFSFQWILAASLLTVLIAMAIALFQFRAGKNNELHIVVLAFALVPLNALLGWASACQLGYSLFKRAQVPSMVLFPVLFLTIVLALRMWGDRMFDAASIVCIQIVATSIALAYALVTLRRTLAPEIASTSAVYETGRWLSGAVTLILVGSVYLLNSNADILMLGVIVGPEAAGIYKVATRGADLVMFSLNVISFPLAPIIARLHTAGDRARLRRAITLSTRVAALTAAPVALGLVFFGHRFLALFGGGFQSGKSALAILSISQLVNAATGPVGPIMIMAGYESRTAIAVTIGAVTNIALNSVLIPHYGVLGAAVATTTSMMLWNGILVFQVWEKLAIDPTIFGFVRHAQRVCDGS